MGDNGPDSNFHARTFDTAAYRPSHGEDDDFNPVPAGVRWGSDRTLYAGTVDEVEVRAGEPFVLRRFDLNRLTLLESPAGNAERIRRFFGLEQTSPHTWNYVHSSPADTIYTLEELRDAVESGATPAREANFFELLQAGIMHGSLGRDGGIRHNQSLRSLASAADGQDQVFERDRNPYLHIMQIGANLIDQYDTDHHPTEIEFNGTSLYGIENLPYLHRWIYYHGRLAPPREDEMAGWALFEVWNPHQNPTSPGTPGAPTQFRIVPDGTLRFEAEPGIGTVDPITNELSISPLPRIAQEHIFTVESASAHVEFDLDQNWNQPTLLVMDRARSTNPHDPTAEDFNGGKVHGIFGGAVPIPASDPRPSDGTRHYVRNSNLSDQPVPGKPGVSYFLQYRLGGSWRTYAVVQRTNTGSHWQNWRTLESTWNQDRAGDVHLHLFYAFHRADPRIDRFGSLRYNEGDHDPANGHRERTMRPTASGGYILSFAGNVYDSRSGFHKHHTGDHTRLGHLAFNQPFASSPGGVANALVSYASPDGVVRRGDSAYINRTSGDFAGKMMGPASNAQAMRSRPIVLNRPFRTVAEMGAASRGEPWKSLDFFTADSADAALLEFFCIGHGEPLISGMVNPNNAPAAVLRALLAEAAKTDPDITGSGSDWNVLTSEEIDAVVVTDAIWLVPGW